MRSRYLGSLERGGTDVESAIPDDTHEITQLLLAWGTGDEVALRQLIPLVHDELRRIARKCMAGERTEHTLQPTALVNEAFLRLGGVKEVSWQNRGHFLAMAARLMRRILVDHARAKHYQKRGGDAVRIEFDETRVPALEPGPQIVALDDALTALAARDERQSRIVELRFFGGLTVEETAAVLEISPETVMRDWKLAKAWLFGEASGAE